MDVEWKNAEHNNAELVFDKLHLICKLKLHIFNSMAVIFFFSFHMLSYFWVIHNLQFHIFLKFKYDSFNLKSFKKYLMSSIQEVWNKEKDLDKAVWVLQLFCFTTELQAFQTNNIKSCHSH